jgi:hypothetical protein
MGPPRTPQRWYTVGRGSKCKEYMLKCVAASFGLGSFLLPQGSSPGHWFEIWRVTSLVIVAGPPTGYLLHSCLCIVKHDSEPLTAILLYSSICKMSRSPWPRGLSRDSAAARFLGLRVRIPPGSWTSVSCECCVLSGRRLCAWPITRPEESYRMWCVWVWLRTLVEVA